MTQDGFDFSVPPVMPVKGTLPPFQGTTPAAVHAGYTGAREVVECLPARVSAYLQVVRNAGAISDHEAATITGLALCSINSIRGYLRKHGPQLEPDGFDVFVYWEQGRERQTKRTRWRLQSVRGDGF